MIALKILAVSAATALMLAGIPAASAEPPPSIDCNMVGQSDACQVPRQANKPKPPRGVSGCVRGVCVLKPPRS